VKNIIENIAFKNNSNPIQAVYQSIGILISLLIVVATFSVEEAVSIPQFAVMEGQKCIVCHVNALGCGLRTLRGFSEMNNVGLIKPSLVGLGGLYRHIPDTNQFLHEKLSLGTDIRFQTYRSPKSSDAKRRYFPMQFSLYSTYKVYPWMKVEGSYNFGPKKYLGQKKGTASLIFQPENSFTQFRIGYFQPSVGVRYDDHTIITRLIGGANGSPLIAPYYAEYGAEFNYNRFVWLTMTAGLYSAQSLAENRLLDRTGQEISLIKNKNNPSAVGRLEFRKRIQNSTVNLLAGSSVLVNGDFNLSNVFVGTGLFNRLSIISEYARSDKKGMRRTHNGVVDFTYRVKKALLVSLRGERGITRFSPDISTTEVYTNQAVFGAELFVLPHIEFRPEYRLVETEQFKSARYAFQIHIY
jgi:hypothetical protein